MTQRVDKEVGGKRDDTGRKKVCDQMVLSRNDVTWARMMALETEKKGQTMRGGSVRRDESEDKLNLKGWLSKSSQDNQHNLFEIVLGNWFVSLRPEAAWATRGWPFLCSGQGCACPRRSEFTRTLEQRKHTTHIVKSCWAYCAGRSWRMPS